jgi:hypothetical protein
MIDRPALELHAYGDDEECEIDVLYPRIRVFGAPPFVHDALDLCDQTPHRGVTLGELLEDALLRATSASTRAAA